MFDIEINSDSIIASTAVCKIGGNLEIYPVGK